MPDYYLTGVSHPREIRFEFQAPYGSMYWGLLNLRSWVISHVTYGAEIAFLYPTIVVDIHRIDNNIQFSVSGTHTLYVPFPSTSIATVSASLVVTYQTEEAIVLHDEKDPPLDEVGNPDYPKWRSYRICEVIRNQDVQFQMQLNSQSLQWTQHIDFLEIEPFIPFIEPDNEPGQAYQVVDSLQTSLEMRIVDPSQLPYTFDQDIICNIMYDNVVLNKVPQMSQSYEWWEETVKYAEATGSIDLNNGRHMHMVYYDQVLGYSPPAVAEMAIGGHFEPDAPVELKLVAYDLDKEHTERITVNVFGEDVEFTGTRTINKVLRHRGYTVRMFGEIVASEHEFVPRKIEVKNSQYRFLLRLFEFQPLTLPILQRSLAFSTITEQSRWQVVQDAQVNVSGGAVHLIASGTSPTVRYTPDLTYLDSARYLRLKLAHSTTTAVNITVTLGNKSYTFNANLSSTPQFFYIDLCAPSNRNEPVDLKNNNFDERDDYAPYWGITKTDQIEIAFSASVDLHALEATLDHPQLSGGESYWRPIIQRSMWQAGKRRFIQVVDNGKQVLELADALTTRELSIEELADTMNSARWEQWSVTKPTEGTCNHNGNVHDLVPCYLNRQRPACWLNGAGIDNTGELAGWEEQLFWNAYVLADEIYHFYPDCGDIIHGTTSAEFKVTAGVTLAATVEGLVVQPDPFTSYTVTVHDSEGNLVGQDSTNEYLQYYVRNDYSEPGQHTVAVLNTDAVTAYTFRQPHVYRVCFRTTAPAALRVNDIDLGRYNHTWAMCTWQPDEGWSMQASIDFEDVWKVHQKASSCQFVASLCHYLDRDLFGAEVQFADFRALRTILGGNDMFGYIRYSTHEWLVTAYDSTQQNFNIYVLDEEFNVVRYRTGILSRQVPEQNLPVANAGGRWFACYTYEEGGQKKMDIIMSDDGTEWQLAKTITL